VLGPTHERIGKTTLLDTLPSPSYPLIARQSELLQRGAVGLGWQTPDLKRTEARGHIMSDQDAVPGAGVKLRGAEARLREVKKRIVPFEQDDPQIEPLFINFAHAAFLGDDVYLDIGVITLESIDPTAEGVGDFAVISRLVMSKRTAIAVRDQIDNVLKEGERAKGETPNAAP